MKGFCGDGEWGGKLLHSPQAGDQVSGGSTEFASPKSCPFSVAGLAVAPCVVLRKGWKQSSSKQ